MKTKVLYIISQIFLYVFASAAAYFFTIVLFTDAINNLRMILHYLPVYLTTISLVYLMLVFYYLARVKDEALLAYKIKVHSIILLSLNAFSFLFGFINTFISFGGNFLSGGPSKAFPLSFLIINLALVALATYLLVVYFKAEKPQIEKVKKRGLVKRIFYHLYLMFALYFLGTFLFGFYSFDLNPVYAFGTFPVYLLLLLPSALIISNEFLKAKGCAVSLLNKRFILGLVFLCLTILLSGWVLIYQIVHPNYIEISLTALFPVDFAISLNIGPLILFLLGIIPSSYFVISYVLLRYCKVCQKVALKRKEKAEKLEE
ncbi:MAG: hypothetical protein WCZ47_02735 [Bacilli bacterium]|jgi:hypothetical protein|nr:hypothetical protein [Bacilli bacterium]NLN80125.1 hypothetical protein [Erysipelotrichia bacterium]